MLPWACSPTGIILKNMIDVTLRLQDGTTQALTLYLCADKAEVQATVKAVLGYLPSDCTDCFWMIQGGVHIAIRRDASPGRIAHEAFHAVAAVAAQRGLDPNDYSIIRPRGDDFGYVPAEVCADLCEQIVNTMTLEVKDVDTNSGG